MYHCNMIPPDFPAFSIHCAPWLAAAEPVSIKQVLPGCGALMRRGSARLAVYRDRGGAIFTFSALCPHCGDTVEWNALDRTWDCVAQGMRFSPIGTAMNGPDGRALQPAG